jgi:4-hydroxybenzoate polyprenyltransferase
MRRWILYQRERFPLAAHAPLVAAFSVSAVCFSSLLRGHVALPRAPALIVAFITALLFFLQLRIADEFKDFEDDATYRPYRPVPRGLVTLGELGWVGAGAAAVQLALALWFDPGLVALLLVAWTDLALMTREFFAPAWLKARPVAYMASHMVILPLVDLYATACDWWPAGFRRPPPGLTWFLAASYLNGIVIEIGRKVRAPADEERGVDTYSALWGRTRAATAWIGAVGATGAAAWQAARQIGTGRATGTVLLILVGVCAAVAADYVRRPTTARAKRIETMAGIWTLLLYLCLGAVPLVWAVWRSA